MQMLEHEAVSVQQPQKQIQPAGSGIPEQTYEALGQRIRAAIDPVRALCVSLHDAAADVLWLSESAMGPDEHNVAFEASEIFKDPAAEPVVVLPLSDTQNVLCIRAAEPRQGVAGFVMFIFDQRVLSQSNGWQRLVTPTLQGVLADFLDLQQSRAKKVAPKPAPVPAATAPTPSLSLVPARQPPLDDNPSLSKSAALGADEPQSVSRMDAAVEPREEVELLTLSEPYNLSESQPSSAPQVSSALYESSELITLSEPHNLSQPLTLSEPQNLSQPPTSSEPLQLAPSPSSDAPVAGSAVSEPRVAVPPSEVPPRATKATSDLEKLKLALQQCPIALNIQRLVPLANSQTMACYEVLLRSKSKTAPNAAPQTMLKNAVERGLGSIIDKRVFIELTSWLASNPSVWQQNTPRFSINLTENTVHDESFIELVANTLSAVQLGSKTVGFEIDTNSAKRSFDAAEKMARSLQRLDCPVVLDDFDLSREAFELLRLPNIGCVKISPALTNSIRSDPAVRASITAITQMARVLLFHTAAKHTTSIEDHGFLAEAGIDFVQSNAIEPAREISALVGG